MTTPNGQTPDEHITAGGSPWRYRVNVKQSVKGVETFDVTVEGHGVTREQQLAELDVMLGALRERFPIASIKGAIDGD